MNWHWSRIWNLLQYDFIKTFVILYNIDIISLSDPLCTINLLQVFTSNLKWWITILMHGCMYATLGWCNANIVDWRSSRFCFNITPCWSNLYIDTIYHLQWIILFCKFEHTLHPIYHVGFYNRVCFFYKPWFFSITKGHILQFLAFCQTYTMMKAIHIFAKHMQWWKLPNSHITLQMGVSDIEYVNVYVLKETISAVELNLKKIASYQMWIQTEAEVSGDTAAYVPVGQYWVLLKAHKSSPYENSFPSGGGVLPQLDDNARS